MMSDSASELKTYYGNCHCGAFKFSIRIPELETFTECNCNICHKLGYKWVFFNARHFTAERDEGLLRRYESGNDSMSHEFCANCGTGVQGLPHGPFQGNDIGINARTLRDVNLWTIESQPFHGAALQSPYIPARFTGILPSADILDSKMYLGDCHCGAVTIAFKAKPLPIRGEPRPEEVEYIQECNCSICTRNGTILVYPQREQVSISDPQNKLRSYIMGRRLQEHRFCSVCGVSVHIEKLPLPNEVAEKWSSAKQRMWAKILPLNLRCMDGINWDQIEVKRSSMALELEPKYYVD